MTVAAFPHPYVASLLKDSGALPGVPHAWLNARRGEALERANALSVPTTRDEEWRFTDLAPLTRMRFTAAEPAQLDPKDIEGLRLPEASVYLTFVDGRYRAELSATKGLPAGVVITDFASALGAQEDVLEAHLARHALFERDVFAAVNTARLHDGALIAIRKRQAPSIEVMNCVTTSDAAIRKSVARRLTSTRRRSSAPGSTKRTYRSFTR